MKILVPVKRVVDFNVKVRVKADQSGVELANASAFVRLHSRCLNRASRWVPGQAGGPTGIDVTTG